MIRKKTSPIIHRVTRVQVQGLFGLFDHDIKLRTADHITLIHGENGLGKTAILKLVTAMFGTSNTEFRRTSFDSLRLDFEDDSYVRVKKEGVNDCADSGADQSLVFDGRIGRGKAETWVDDESDTVPSQHARRIREMFEHYAPVSRVAPSRWLDHRTGRHLNFNEVVEVYGDELPFKLPRSENEPKWLKTLRSRVKVRFVKVQRLLKQRDVAERRHRAGGYESAVQRYSEQFKEDVKETQRLYGQRSQELDRTFPMRVIKRKGKKSLPDERLRQELDSIGEKRAELVELRLLPKDDGEADVEIENLDAATRRLLGIYVEDVKEKLRVVDSLAQRVKLLMKIINARFKYKNLHISPEGGFVFKSTVGQGRDVRPTDLSSGEQHELVLFYEFLFKVGAHSLLLIDEPELSLHISWQKKFLHDLQEIVQIAPFDVVVATHSPQIIHDRWDLTEELMGPADA